MKSAQFSFTQVFWLRMWWAWEWDLHIYKEEKEASCRLWKCEKRNTRENFQSEMRDSFCDRQKEKFKCKLTRPSKQCKSLIWIMINKHRCNGHHDIGQYWVFTGQYWLVFDGTWSVWVILVVTWCYWVSITWYWLVLSGTGLIKGFYACIYWKN